ncbi:MAG: sterol desaturase family protein [Bacteroidia bacterium]|nr:sterol desaturase family protein [Bacteroidia bacterium]
MNMSALEYWWREATGALYDYFFYASIVFVLFYVILRKPLWYRKVQKKMPKLSDYGRDIMYSIISVTIFATVALTTFRFLGEYVNTYKEIEEYGMVYYIFTWVYMFFIHDTYFYWMHRMMHMPQLFKHVHLVHHKSTNPSPWTAYAFHPFEAFLEAMIIPILAFGLPLHRYAIGSFLLFQIMYNVYGHLGFEIYPKNFHKTWIGRFINTSVAHNLHHKRFRGNYGLYFLTWDRWMGTVRNDYDKTYEETTAPEKKQEAPVAV